MRESCELARFPHTTAHIGCSLSLVLFTKHRSTGLPLWQTSSILVQRQYSSTYAGLGHRAAVYTSFDEIPPACVGRSCHWSIAMFRDWSIHSRVFPSCLARSSFLLPYEYDTVRAHDLVRVPQVVHAATAPYETSLVHGATKATTAAAAVVAGAATLTLSSSVRLGCP